MVRNVMLLGGLFLLFIVGPPQVRGAIDDASIHQAIAKLNDPNPAVRERATRLLWSSGSLAEPALREAAGSDDLEVASRARTILRNIESGLLPDTPGEILDLLEQYRGGTHAQRATAVNRLADLGPRGLRVLLALRRLEKDPSDRQVILAVLTPHAQEAAASLIGEGDFDAAHSLLLSAAALGKTAARDAAAFSLLRQNTGDQIASLKKELDAKADAITARQLTFLARAAGDLPTARWAAERASDPSLVDSILIEQSDWKTLDEHYRSRPGDSDSIETLAFAATFARLAGDATGFQKAIEAIKAHVQQHPDEYWKSAETLLLNDRIDDAIEMLIAQKDYYRASQFLIPRLDYRRVVELSRLAQAQRHPDRWRIKLREAVALRYMGQMDAARRIVADITADPAALVADQWAMVIETDREMGEEAEAERHLALGLSVVLPETSELLLQQSGVPEGFPATEWWDALRRRNRQESPIQTLKTLRDLAHGTLPLDQMQKLGDAALAESKVSHSHRSKEDQRVRSVADALLAAGKAAPALHYFQKIAEGGAAPELSQRIGDCQAALGDFSAAAEAYGRAWELDRSRALPLALRAWALRRAGKESEAHSLFELAHLLPLSNDVARLELADALSEHDLKDEAQREQDLILRAGPFLSGSRSRVISRKADEALQHQDYLTASELVQNAFLGNLQTGVTFMQPWANAAIPALIHKYRAMGLVRKGDAPGALDEAKRCLADTPGDADSLIQLVLEFEQHQGKPQADELFALALPTFKKGGQEFPDSGPAHNLVAWFEGKCRRNLDEALREAQRATALEPTNTASLDTLAEVRFARGEVPAAIEAIQRCIALEPNVAHHREQLSRFESAGKK